MGSYGTKSTIIEWSKWLVFKLGNMIGFTSPLLASFAGCGMLGLAWLVVPDSINLIRSIPLIWDFLREAGVTTYGLNWFNGISVALGTIGGLMCWARVAVLTMPDTFDRYKIKGVPL